MQHYYSPAYRNAVALQRFLSEKVLNDDVDDKAISGIVKAWVELERLKRDMLGKPNPKPIDVTALLKKKQPGLIELNPT